LAYFTTNWVLIFKGIGRPTGTLLVRLFLMNTLESIGKMVALLGVVLACTGGLIWLAAKIPGLEKLPGTIKITGSGFTCLIPLLALIVLSLLLTFVLNVIVRLINR